MNAPNDGGPAFPTKREALDPRATGWSMQEGMTLRDWFAGMALQGYLAGRNHHPTSDPSGFEATKSAKQCYGYADAMLAARERKDEQ